MGTLNLGPFGSYGFTKGPQQKASFNGKGNADPVAALQSQLHLMDALMQKLNMKGPSRLSSHAPTGMPAAPIHVPGVPFQIGGGLGTDPAAPAPDPSQAVAGQAQQDPFADVLNSPGLSPGYGQSGRFAGEIPGSAVQRRKP